MVYLTCQKNKNKSKYSCQDQKNEKKNNIAKLKKLL